MSHLKSRFPQIGRECSSLKAYEGVFRYKIVCTLLSVLIKAFIQLDLLFSNHRKCFLDCHADVLARKRIALLYILVGAAGMCAIGTESRDHCEKRGCGNGRVR